MLGATVALALSLSPAMGHKTKYDTNLQLKIDVLTETTDQFSGKVTSEKGKCRRNRNITVTSGGVAIAFATTDGAGNWTAIGSRPPKLQDVTASTPRKFLKRNKKHKHKCKPDSRTRKAP